MRREIVQPPLAKSGRPTKMTPKMRARALELWSDPRVRSANDVADILRQEGITVSVSTLYKNLPSRGEAIEMYVDKLVEQQPT